MYDTDIKHTIKVFQKLNGRSLFQSPLFDLYRRMNLVNAIDDPLTDELAISAAYLRDELIQIVTVDEVVYVFGRNLFQKQENSLFKFEDILSRKFSVFLDVNVKKNS